MLKGKYVSRSTYQKVAEENKKLKQDILALLDEGHPDHLEVWGRWISHFNAKAEQNALMDLVLKAADKVHPKR
jgi:hypothetical protein